MVTIARRMCGIVALLWLLAASGLALAQTPPSTQSIGSITSAASNGTDKSMSALQLIYGAIASNPLSGGSSSTSASSSNGLISQVFLVLNSCILAVGVIWAMYHFGSAMIATGQDGEFLGQKKSSPWFIIRMGVGFTGLVPMFGGYCGAQVIMLWATMMGVGIANLAMSAAVGVLTSGGSLVAVPVVPQVSLLAKSLFESNLCAAAANRAVANLPNDASVSADGSEVFSASTTNTKIVLMNRNGLSCGGAEIDANAGSQAASSASSSNLTAYAPPDTSAMQSSLLSAQQNALAQMEATLSSAAQSYVLAVDSQTQPSDPQATIDQAAQAYQDAIQAAISSESNSMSGMASTIEANLTRDGWIMLGAWYQSFAQANAQLSDVVAAVATPVPSTDLGNLPYPQLYQSVMASYGQQIEQDASTSLAGGALSTTTAMNNLYTGTGTGTDPQTVLTQWFPGKKLVNDIMSQLSGSAQSGSAQSGSAQSGNGNGMPLNPLIGMKVIGDDIIGAARTFLATSIRDQSDKKNNTSASNGTDADTAKEALRPFVVIIAIALFVPGVMLSIYLPMLPFIVWFSGVVSWFMVVAEAMVASPLWAMTHLDGDGEGLGSRTQHGYVFLLNVMFRPVFMVFGFLLAGASVVVLGTLLNTMFGVAMQNAQYGSTTGLVTMIGFVVLYVGMCQTLCNSAFSLIHVIPDNVFSWIGAQMARSNGGFEENVKHGFDSSVNQGGSDARSLGAGAAGRLGGAPATGVGRSGLGTKGGGIQS